MNGLCLRRKTCYGAKVWVKDFYIINSSLSEDFIKTFASCCEPNQKFYAVSVGRNVLFKYHFIHEKIPKHRTTKDGFSFQLKARHHKSGGMLKANLIKICSSDAHCMLSGQIFIIRLSLHSQEVWKTCLLRCGLCGP